MDSIYQLTTDPWDHGFFGSFAASPRTYGLEQALTVSPDSNSSFVFSPDGHVFNDACPSSSGQNCNASCNNTFGFMFDSLPTLHNCFMFGYMTDDLDTATKLHYIDADHNATVAHVAHILEDCLSKYCDTLSDCSEEASEYGDLPSLWGDYDTLGRGQGLASSICDNIPWRINSDVGGIGIYVSYWIQTGLAFLGLVGTLFWKWIVPNGHSCYQAFNYGWRAAESRSQRLNQVAQQHLSRLVAALTDFHKAQCFFMMAINIAALAVIQRGGFDPQSLQQIYNTYVFLQVLAVNGFLPITFTLTNLYLVGMLSWFLILLSAVTVVLSIATLASVGRFDPSEADMRSLETLAASGGPQECDGINPGIYCLRTMEYNHGWDYFYGGQSAINYAYRILGFCLANMAVLVGCQLRVKDLGVVRSAQNYAKTRLYSAARLVLVLSRITHRQIATRIPSAMGQAARTHWKQMSHILTNSSKTPARLRSTRSWQFCLETALRIQEQQRTLGWQSSLKLALRAAVYVVFLTFYVRFYNIYLHDLAWFAKNDVHGNTWNFGQVFAITVWVPPIVEYVHLEMRRFIPASPFEAVNTSLTGVLGIQYLERVPRYLDCPGKSDAVTVQGLWICFTDVRAIIGGMHRAFDHRLLPPFRVSRTGRVDTMNILPTRSGEQDELESGNRNLSGPVELTTPTSASLATPSKHDDDNVGEAINIQDNDRFHGCDNPHRDQYDEFHTQATGEANSSIPLTSTIGDGNGDRFGPSAEPPRQASVPM